VSGSSGLGYSQLNELLLLLGFDRASHSFFQFLVVGGGLPGSTGNAEKLSRETGVAGPNELLIDRAAKTSVAVLAETPCQDGVSSERS
jgi:hypothetical protein